MHQDIRQTKNYKKFLQDNGCLVKDNIFILPIPKCNTSFIKIQRSKYINFKKVSFLSKKYNASNIRVELMIEKQKSEKVKKSLLNHGFKKSENIDTSTKTILIDLKKSIDQIYKETKSAKRHIKKAKNNQVEIKIISGEKNKKFESEKNKLFRLIKKHQGYKNLGKYPEKWLNSLIKNFKDKSWLIIGYKGKKIASGGIFLCSRDAMHYIRGASNNLGYKNSASYLMMWSAIKLAKELNLKTFDMEGIFDQRYQKTTNSWKGFTQFKKSFGGQEIEFIETYEKNINKKLNIIEKIIKKIFMFKNHPRIYP